MRYDIYFTCLRFDEYLGAYEQRHKLNPTGRWKLVFKERGTELHIEHRSWLLFKQWIREDMIHIDPLPKEMIFSCKVSE